jgi:hypothetical protein
MISGGALASAIFRRMSSSCGVQRRLRLSTMDGCFPFAGRSVPPKVWAAGSACLVRTLRFAFGPGRERASLIWSVRARWRTADALRLAVSQSLRYFDQRLPSIVADRVFQVSTTVPLLLETDSLAFRQIDAILAKLQWSLREASCALGLLFGRRLVIDYLFDHLCGQFFGARGAH